MFKMWAHIETYKKTCGGVCGYMHLRTEGLEVDDHKTHDNIDFISKIILKLTDIQRAQQVEYHFGHLLDKPF